LQVPASRLDCVRLEPSQLGLAQDRTALAVFVPLVVA
jgi:hypothetical protein